MLTSSIGKIPYIDLSGQHKAIKAELLRAVEHVLDHGIFILGEEVAEFERQFAELCNVQYAVGVGSGTDALVIALRALGIGPGDEVITVPNSFVASTSSITLVGAVPIFVDVREDYNIDPTLIEHAITSRTKAIIPVHLTGRPADMDPIMKVAKSHHLHVIEDCAQAVLAEYKGRKVGSFGTIGCFSLHPLKTLNACGDGGVLTTDDPGLFEQFKILRNIGLKTRDDCVVWSGNSRLDTLQAAILLVKLKYVGEWTEKRRANAAYYQETIADVSGIQFVIDRPYERAVYHTFVIQADRRNELKQYLADHGVDTAIHYPIPIHLHKAAKQLNYREGSFPISERQAQRILSLPVFPELTSDQLHYVAKTIREFYGG